MSWQSSWRPRASHERPGLRSNLVKRRRTKAEMRAFREAVWDIVHEHQPCSARQVYYRAVVAGLIKKDTGNSNKHEQHVWGALNWMREQAIDLGYYNGGKPWSLPRMRADLVMPFAWITDNTRTRYQAELFASKDAAITDLAHYYRRDLWRSQPRLVEVWCESESIAGVLQETTNEYGLALLPCKGQPSKRFIWDSARAYANAGKPVVCLYIGDFDPHGLDIGRSAEERLRRYGAPEGTAWRRLAITPQQVADQELPGHGLNANIKGEIRQRFLDVCYEHGIPFEAVEAEAMAPADLRELVDDAICQHVDQRQWVLEEQVEREERKSLWDLARNHQ